MPKGLTIECRFFGQLSFGDEDADSDADKVGPASEELAEMNAAFELAVRDLLQRPHWGTLDWVEVSIGEDDSNWPDSTLIEYLFRSERKFSDAEIDDDSGEGALTAQAQQALEAEFAATLDQHYHLGTMRLSIGP